MLRKLASIQKVIGINPIPNADRVERITINGWTVVSQKGNFQIGDLGVFFETDSIPPDMPLYNFLWQTASDTEAGIVTPRPAKYRLKTMKLRKQLSQGLMLPLGKVMAAYDEGGFQIPDPEEGLDLTKLLDIEKWEPPIATGGQQDGTWSFSSTGISKTDEERVQSRPLLINELIGLPYYISLKYDGMSFTAGFDIEGIFRVNNRNDSMTPADNVWWKMAEQYNLEEFCEDSKMIVQGELVGPSIQKNLLSLRKPDLYVFNLFDTTQHTYLDFDRMINFCEAYDLNMVEVLEEGDDFQYSLEELLEKAKGKYNGTQNHREGIVVRPKEVFYSDVLGGRMSFKVINNDFALAEAKDKD